MFGEAEELEVVFCALEGVPCECLFAYLDFLSVFGHGGELSLEVFAVELFSEVGVGEDYVGGVGFVDGFEYHPSADESLGVGGGGCGGCWGVVFVVVLELQPVDKQLASVAAEAEVGHSGWQVLHLGCHVHPFAAVVAWALAFGLDDDLGLRYDFAFRSACAQGEGGVVLCHDVGYHVAAAHA